MEIRYRRELVDLLRHLELPLIGCELGVAEGLFSRDLLASGMEKLYCVDTWSRIPGVTGDGGFPQGWHDNNFMLAKQKIKPYGDKAVILRGKSKNMAEKVEDESLSLLYIDADHSYWGVLTDLNAWVPKVRKGGVVALHDYENISYGVKPAVQDFCNGNYKIHLLPEDKPDDAGAYFIKQ